MRPWACTPSERCVPLAVDGEIPRSEFFCKCHIEEGCAVVRCAVTEYGERKRCSDVANAVRCCNSKVRRNRGWCRRLSRSRNSYQMSEILNGAVVRSKVWSREQVLLFADRSPKASQLRQGQGKQARQGPGGAKSEGAGRVVQRYSKTLSQLLSFVQVGFECCSC